MKGPDQEQIDLFPETLVEPGQEPVLRGPPGMSCADCKHIQGVQFGDKRLYFCTIKRRDSNQYGVKIAKHARTCICFREAGDNITVLDGHYGGVYKEAPRTKRRRHSK